MNSLRFSRVLGACSVTIAVLLTGSLSFAAAPDRHESAPTDGSVTDAKHRRKRPRRKRHPKHPHAAVPRERLSPPVQGMKDKVDGETEGDIRLREEWFYQQRAYPLGSIPAGARQKALEQLDQMLKAQREAGLQRGAAPESLTTGFPGPSTWTSIGPQPTTSPGFNFGTPVAAGRVNALAVDPTDSNTVYLGGAFGGVWKSTNGGDNWATNFDQQASIAIGAIAIAPSDRNTIYVGTGENNFASDSYYGAGIIKSTDGGASWTQMGTPPGAPFAGAFGPGRLSGGMKIGAIAVHPTDPNTLLVAAGSGSAPGIFRSSNGGAAFINVLPGTAGTSVVFDPSNPLNVYAALGNAGGGAVNGIYKSTNGGVAFLRLLNGLPTTNVGRIELAISPSLPATLYAAIADSSSQDLLGLFKSTDGGSNWSQLSSTPNFCAGQCFYDMAVRVHPTNPSIVFIGGSAFTDNSSTLWRTPDGGATWTNVTAGSDTVRPHVDTHAFGFSADGSRLYVGNDGGAWRTDNSTASAPLTWINLNSTLSLTQFYPGHAVHPSDENIGFGGTQDNGTQRYTGPLQWDFVTCGDGAWAAVDPNAPTTVYGNCQDIDVRRSFRNGGFGTFSRVDTQILASSDRSQFIPPLVHDPSLSGRLYFGSCRVWQTTDFADNWAPISPDLTGTQSSIGCPVITGGQNITTIAPSKSNADVVYVGTTDGKVQKTTNAGAGAGATWTDVTGTAQLPSRFITMVAIDPANADTAYVSFSGFSGFVDAKGHIFKTTSGGTTWTDISGAGAGALPNTPVNDLVIDPDVANTLYIATDVGVFQSTDGGMNWSPLTSNLPRVAVTSLAFRRASRTLRAATHGRGAWLLQLPAAAGLLLSSISPSSAPAGSGPVSVTLDGQAFTGSSVVRWNGSPSNVTTSFVSANQLTAVVGSPLLASAGLANINVVDGLNSSSSLPFSVTGTAPTLAAINPQSILLGSPAFSLAVTGSGFSCSGPGTTVIHFRGASLSPGNCSATSITVSVPANLVATSGSVNVTAFAPPPFGGSSSALVFQVLGADFSVAAANPTSATINAGQSAAFTINLATQGGSLANAVTFSVSGLPAASAATFNPTSIAAGSTTGSTTLRIVTTARSSVPPEGPSNWPAPWQRPAGAVWPLGLVLVLASLAIARHDIRTRRGIGYLPLAFVLLWLAGVWACGGGGSRGPGTPAGTSTVTITGTSGSLARTTTVTLTVN